MALVTRKFRDDFETWAAHRVVRGDFSEEDIEEIRKQLRTDFSPGPDQVRAGLSVVVDGFEIPAAIDNHEERYRLWADFFETEAEAIRRLKTNGVQR